MPFIGVLAKAAPSGPRRKYLAEDIALRLLEHFGETDPTAFPSAPDSISGNDEMRTLEQNELFSSR